jgi:DNA-binding transcriptional LysR family regulator
MKEPVVELRLWRQFLAVAEELHFGRAAARLHMTQPPLTQAIALLERRLGVRLFERSKRRVALTPAGEALRPQARELLERAAALASHARAAAQGEIGRLRIAFVSTVGFDLLPGWVRGFREAHPQVGLELVEATSDVQAEMLARGEVDAGFVLHSPGMAPALLERMGVSTEPLVLAVPQSHALARARTLPAAAVLAEPLVIFPRHIAPSLHDAVFSLYHQAAREPDVAQEAIQMQTIVNLVAAGLGLAWVPDSVRRFQREGVVYRPLRSLGGHPVPRCETSLVWRGPPGPVLSRFLAFARTQLRA